jgi:hypothetical protein
MPTFEQVRRWADDFEQEYPEDLAARLRWFVNQLGVRPEHLLRMMGMSRQRIEAMVEDLAENSLDWSWVINEVGEESAWWAESPIGQALVLYQYDWRALKERLSRPVDKEFEVVQPGGCVVPLSRLSAAQREEALLTLAAQEGSRSVTALIAFLSQRGGVPTGS